MFPKVYVILKEVKKKIGGKEKEKEKNLTTIQFPENYRRNSSRTPAKRNPNKGAPR